jgi:hypothetical protein
MSGFTIGAGPRGLPRDAANPIRVPRDVPEAHPVSACKRLASSSSASLKIVQKRRHVPHDRVSHRRIPLIVRHVGPVRGLARLGGDRWQCATDREDVRGARNVVWRDRRRFPVRDRDAVCAQSSDCPSRQIVLWSRTTECGSIRKPSVRGELVEVRRRDHALGGAMFTHKNDVRGLGWRVR